MITFDIQPTLVLVLIVSTLLPILTGLVTTKITSSKVKALVLALLSAITGLGTELLAALQAGVPYDLFVGLLTAITVFVIAVALHFGLWKPTGAADKVQSLGGVL